MTKPMNGARWDKAIRDGNATTALWNFLPTQNHYANMISVFIYIYVCVCVCVCVELSTAREATSCAATR
jgi:hypothetical protein